MSTYAKQQKNPIEMSQVDTQKNNVVEILIVLEHQMKNLWSQYMACLDVCGNNEDAKVLREKYFKLYHSYKSNKEWQNVIENS